MKPLSLFFMLVLLTSAACGCMPVNQQPAPSATAATSVNVPTASSQHPTQTPIPSLPSRPPTSTPTPGPLLPIRGVMVPNFLRRGFGSGYYSGDVIHEFDVMDPVVGHTVGEEVSLQLDLMKQMRINEIAFELRSSDPTYIPGPFKPPECNIGPNLGAQYPAPTSSEVKNLVEFFDLVQSKGMKVYLLLDSTHMEEQPPKNNTIWIDSLVNAIKDHPALELITFGGSDHVYGQGSNAYCGLPAEPPLYYGFGSEGANYVKWAIKYAHSLGVPYRKLSAEAMVGDYYFMHNASGFPQATGNHLWDPILVLKQIFDDLAIPADQRTYAISFYEHQKCDNSINMACTGNASPHAWALETIQDVFNVNYG
jgi:hypothetical protein